MSFLGTSTNVIYQRSETQYVRLTLYWERTAYSVKNNTSTILVRVGQTNVGLPTTWGDCTYTFSMTQAGTHQGIVNLSLEKNAQQILYEQTFTLNHSTGGNALNLNFTYSLIIPGGDSTQTLVSHSSTLSALPDYPTLTAPPSFNDEANPAIRYSVDAASEEFITKLEACIADGTTGTSIYVNYREISKLSDTYTFNLTSSERTALRRAAGDANNIPVRFYIKTTFTNGETGLISKNSVLFITAAVPILNPTAKDVNPITLALTNDNQIIIPGFSDIEYASNAVARKGAVLASETVVCGIHRSTSGSGTFNNVLSGDITFTATDNRGNAASSTLSLQVVKYVHVSCRQEVVLNENGTVDITLTGNYFNGSFGEYDNTLKLEIRHTQNDGSYGAWQNLTPLGYTMSGSTYTLNYTISGFDQSGTYDFQSRATDELGTATTTAQTIIWYPIFDWGKNDFNFNVPVYANEINARRVQNSSNLYIESDNDVNITAGNESYISLDADYGVEMTGPVVIDGRQYGLNKVLWSGESHMNGGQTANLSESIYDQPNGIVLVFSSYEGGAAMDDGINTFFVSKYQVNSFSSSSGHTFFMVSDPGFSSVGAKTLYISSSSIKGAADNTKSATYNGIQFVNSNFILRYVIGV